MKLTYNFKLMFEDNTFIGIDMGADYCYEHESGIAGIFSNFGCDRSKDGFEKNLITVIPDGLKFTKFIRYGKTCYAIFFDNLAPNVDFRQQIIRPFSDEKMICAYDNDSFQIVFTKENKKCFEELKKAFDNKDIAFMVNEHVSPFRSGGFKIVIASRVSQKVKDEMLAIDLGKKEIINDFRKTHIEILLKLCGKKYHCLVPDRYDGSFKPNNRELKTKYNVVAFLNPQEQRKYNCGWYTIEELRDWAFNKGIVLKKEDNANE